MSLLGRVRAFIETQHRATPEGHAEFLARGRARAAAIDAAALRVLRQVVACMADWPVERVADGEAEGARVHRGTVTVECVHALKGRVRDLESSLALAEDGQ